MTVEPLGIYIHVPFCDVACRYCNFFFVVRRADLHEGYVGAVRRELARWADDPRVAGRPVESVYFGGGTPSSLSGTQVASILEDARRLYPIQADAEVTLEANPGSLHDAKLAEFRAAGVNRLSIGVQSFHDDERRMIWRTHTADEAERSVLAARREGFENLNVDLMFAIPRQTLPRWEATIARTCALGVEHVSTYCLTVEEGTPLSRHVAEGRVPRAGEEVERAMYLRAIELLEAAGYGQYEISNFARPGRQSRHNLACWRRGEYLGIGPGAHGFLDPERWSNVRDVPAYVRRMEAGEDVREMRESLTPEQARLEALWLGLRTTRGLDLGGFRARFGEDLRETRRAVLEEVSAVGQGRIEEERLVLTPEGRALADEITRRLI